MGIQEETCIATPGFAGFVPSMSMKYGMTFGNATKEILKTDPYLKKGHYQQEVMKRVQMQKQTAQDVVPREETDLWKGKNTYATGDDRFSFPPVPGYTGYIARSQDHFGRPFVETTNASLLDFKRMMRSKNTLPPKVTEILRNRKAKEQEAKRSGAEPQKQVHISSFDPYAKTNMDDMSPYKLPKDHPQKTFISGYTGFVPRLQHHFGEPYSHIVRRAIDDFSQTKNVPANPYSIEKASKKPEPKAITTKPIPGFTGFIPSSRTFCSMSFGKTAEVAYDQFNHRDDKGRMPPLAPTMPIKDLKKTKPIAGYRGHKAGREQL